MGDLIFVTGGARSGKSTFAERLAARSNRAVTYIATLDPDDDEMRDRVARHRSRRPASWRTIEAPDALVDALGEASAEDYVVIDCISVWIANRLLALPTDEPSPSAVAALETALTAAVEALIEAIEGRTGTTIVVTNEVGAGVVPAYALGRVYRDLLGRANQQLAGIAARAWLLVAGRALELPPA